MKATLLAYNEYIDEYNQLFIYENPKKDYYAKGETLEVDVYTLTKEKLLKINRTNTCT